MSGQLSQSLLILLQSFYWQPEVNLSMKSVYDEWIKVIFYFSIYTLSDLGDLSNLIGSLSRTIQQYSPPSEWIIWELGVFPVFFRERSFKSRQNPRADFF